MFTGLFSPQVLAQSCKSLLTEQHVIGEHYGKYYKKNYEAAISRFNIESNKKNPREAVRDYFNQIDKRYTLALKDESELEKLRSEWLERALIKKVPKKIYIRNAGGTISESEFILNFCY